MEIDPLEELSLKRKAESLRSLCTGHFASSITKLSNTSRRIPSGKDFHYFFNFDEFRTPVDLIGENSQAMLESAGTSSHIWAKEMAYPGDLDDAYDWLVNVNDEIFERLDVSMDEFTAARKGDEKGSGRGVYLDGGFQMVYGKKKKGTMVGERPLGLDSAGRHNGVKVASRDKKLFVTKPRIPFHIPTIPRPQKTFNILVNNSNEPFQHVWLPRSEDDMRFVHPLENHSALDFVETDSGCIKSSKPGLMASTPFKLVQEVKDLKEVAAKLSSVNEFAVDLEHNQYRSFQGLTCLMQISTRSEDFIIDTLKLRIHVGPYFREVFKDPKKKKVMHGADRDIVWLQRDFGIYVCNLFDTGQASRVLKLERNSLEYLLYHYCDVTANKEYQNADWRLRPFPPEMLRYAREDTHYLLHIYDLMRMQLLGMNAGSANTDEPIVEVYKRSYDICMQLYEKELFTDTSYLNIYGLQAANFSTQQLAVVSGLCQWRDFVARSEDESTGYILPNKTLLEIAKHMPTTSSKLRDIIKAKHHYAEHHLGAIVSIVRHSVQNASAFELAMMHHKVTKKDSLRGVRLETNTNGVLGLEPSIASKIMSVSADVPEGIRSSCPVSNEFLKPEECGTQGDACSTGYHSAAEVNVEKCGSRSSDIETGMTGSSKVAEVIVQKLDKPTRAFGAFFGNTSKKNFDAIKNVHHLEDAKLQQIKSSVSLPFYSFSFNNNETVPAEAATPIPETPQTGYESEHTPLSATVDVIPLDTLADGQKSEDGNSEELNEEQHPMSLSDLVSGFQQCVPSRHKNKEDENGQKGRHTSQARQFVPFDYETAREHIKFGENDIGIGGDKLGSASRSDGSTKKILQSLEQCGVPPQGRRRLAFPSSGNRSATFR